MPFTDNEIKKYLDTIHNYTKSPKNETDRKISC